jgi:hypothetical protein
LVTWISEGRTTASSETPSIPVVTSDVYEWVRGGFFVIHSAYGKKGHTSVAGLEVLGADGDTYRPTFCDSFGTVHVSQVDIDGDTITWQGEHTRCVATMSDEGFSRVAHREVTTESGEWTPSMDVTLRLVR